MNYTNHTLFTNTQLTHYTLRIGAASIGRRPDPDSSQPAPLTAGLWIYYRDDPTQDRQVRVQAGEKLSVAGYQIEVVAIEADPPAHVQLRLSDPPPVPVLASANGGARRPGV
jgi:hypothetical protein